MRVLRVLIPMALAGAMMGCSQGQGPKGDPGPPGPPGAKGDPGPHGPLSAFASFDFSTNSNVEAGKSLQSAGSAQPNRGSAHVMIARMVNVIARIIPKANSNLAGSGFGATSPLLARDRCRYADFRGANRERCVSYVTLRWLSKKCTCAGLNCGPRQASR